MGMAVMDTCLLCYSISSDPCCLHA